MENGLRILQHNTSNEPPSRVILCTCASMHDLLAVAITIRVVTHGSCSVVDFGEFWTEIHSHVKPRLRRVGDGHPSMGSYTHIFCNSVLRTLKRHVSFWANLMKTQ